MRCYNGCPDKELQAVLDANAAAKAALATKGLHAVWFPMEGKWHAFGGVCPVGEFQDTLPELARSLAC